MCDLTLETLTNSMIISSLKHFTLNIVNMKFHKAKNPHTAISCLFCLQ